MGNAMPRAPRDAFAHAVTLLASRERTREGLRAALLAKGHDEAEVEAALTRAAQLGYLDDAKVAQARARRDLARGRSRADVARRLATHGVDETVAAAATRAAAEEVGHDDEASARALLAKRRLTGVKAARLLAARGFDEALVRRLTGVGDD